MTTPYNGNAGAIAAGQTVTIQKPIDGDADDAATFGAFATLADFTAFLMSKAAEIDQANTFTAGQVLNGAPGDDNATMKMTSTPTIRKLIWEGNLGPGGLGAGHLVKGRIYARNTSLPGFEFTVNAKWDSTQFSGAGGWVADETTLSASLYALGYASPGDPNQSLKARAFGGGISLKTDVSAAWTTWDARNSSGGAITGTAAGCTVQTFLASPSLDGNSLSIYCELKFANNVSATLTAATLAGGLLPIANVHTIARLGDGSGVGDTFTAGTNFVDVHTDGTIACTAAVVAPASLAFQATFLLA